MGCGSTINRYMLLVLALTGSGNCLYLGKEIGSFRTLQHQAAGTVFAVNYTHIAIKDFTYDGLGPDAFFWIGSTQNVSSAGTIVPDTTGSLSKLRSYDNELVILVLPNNIQVGTPEFRWISVWCRAFAANFAELYIPQTLAVPAQVDVGEFSRLAHQVRSARVIIEDHRTFLINDLFYDGRGPDAFFIIGNGTVGSTGYVKVNDERQQPVIPVLRGYQGQDIRIQVPEGRTIMDNDYLSMYCISFTQNFGNINIPPNLNVPAYIGAPSIPTTPSTAAPPPQIQDWDTELMNCENIHERLNIAWEIQGNQIVFETIFRPEQTDEYVAFGLSGSNSEVNMIGADVVVTYFDNGQPKAVDHFLEAYAQCSNGDGACPDTSSNGNDDSIVEQGSQQNGITKIRYTRELSTGDTRDRDYVPNSPQYIAWAIGILTPEKFVTRHHTRTPDRQTRWTFGRNPVKNCKSIGGVPVATPSPTPTIGWKIPHLLGKDTNNRFRVTMGPAGGLQGYQAITGQASWGIAYYVNDLLIPELTLRRGETYTFDTDTGDDPSLSAKYHPVYITDDPRGGYVQLSAQDRQAYTVFAGLDGDVPRLGSVGPYCEYRYREKSGNVNADDYSTFADYFTQLQLECDTTEPSGTFTFTPDQNTPDLVYYQCFTHNRLGWKIHIVDAYPDETTPPSTGWPVSVIDGSTVNRFIVRIGPTGGDKGYNFITGKQSWGIAYYINGLLIPELILVRNYTYQFEIEAGNDTANTAKYHPFYITDDPRGGYVQYNAEQRQAVKTYIGVRKDGSPSPHAAGTYCEYRTTGDDAANIASSATFADYAQTLTEHCDTKPGEARTMGVMTWTPDDNTPDLLYYQCYTHFRLGWKIHIVDGPGMTPAIPQPEPDHTTESATTESATTEPTSTLIMASAQTSIHIHQSVLFAILPFTIMQCILC